jgi:hypothetical protein
MSNHLADELKAPALLVDFPEHKVALLGSVADRVLDNIKPRPVLPSKLQNTADPKLFIMSHDVKTRLRAVNVQPSVGFYALVHCSTGHDKLQALPILPQILLHCQMMQHCLTMQVHYRQARLKACVMLLM